MLGVSIIALQVFAACSAKAVEVVDGQRANIPSFHRRSDDIPPGCVLIAMTCTQPDIDIQWICKYNMTGMEKELCQRCWPEVQQAREAVSSLCSDYNIPFPTTPATCAALNQTVFGVTNQTSTTSRGTSAANGPTYATTGTGQPTPTIVVSATPTGGGSKLGQDFAGIALLVALGDLLAF